MDLCSRPLGLVSAVRICYSHTPKSWSYIYNLPNKTPIPHFSLFQLEKMKELRIYHLGNFTGGNDIELKFYPYSSKFDGQMIFRWKCNYVKSGILVRVVCGGRVASELCQVIKLITTFLILVVTLLNRTNTI